MSKQSTDAGMRAVVVDARQPERLAIWTVPRPEPKPHEMLVRVKAISLNRGETRMALREMGDGWRPGWDAAGIVERAAADGSGPPPGARVVCMNSMAAWAEYVCVAAPAAAVIPEGVSFEEAACLPVAALTARRALALAAPLAGRKVLIDGASGGVGTFALQLARLAGATTIAAIRNPAQAELMRRLGANEVAVGEALAGAARFGPYDVILESVGGDTLGQALAMLAPGGLCVLLGASAGSRTAFDAARFRVGGTKLYGLVMAYEFRHEPPGVGLADLLALMAEGKLRSEIAVTAEVDQIAAVSAQLMERAFAGKAVLTL